MNLSNDLNSLYNSGTIIQTINISPKIDASISLLSENFYKGEIKLSLIKLNDLINENSNFKEVQYQLFLVKLNFLIELRKVDEYIKLVNYIEKKFDCTNDIKFKQFKLNSLCFQAKEEEYYNLVDEVLMLSSNTEKEYLEATYMLNNNQIKSAKEIFEKHFLDSEDEKILLLGSIIYRNLCDHFEDENFTVYYEKAIKLYDKYIKLNSKKNIFKELDIISFKATFSMQKTLNQVIISDNEKEFILNFIDSIDKLTFDELRMFDKKYFSQTLNNYLFSLDAINNLDKFKDIAKKYIDDLLIENWFICYELNEELNSEIVIKKFKETHSLQLIEMYLNYLIHKSKSNEVIDFIEKNNLLNESDLFLSKLISAKMLLKEPIDEYLESITNNKQETIFNLILYCRVQIYLKDKIDEDDINKLINYIEDEKLINFTILDILIVLFYVKRYDKIFEIGIKYHNKFKNIINDILRLSLQEKELNLNSLKKFISNIKNLTTNNNLLLATIYQSYKDYSSALNILKLEWSKKDDIQIARGVLHNLLILTLYHGEINKKEIEQYTQYLLSKDSLYNDIIISIYLARYYFYENQFQKSFETFNHTVLQADIDNLTQDEKNLIASFFGVTIEINNYDYMSDISNQILNKDGVRYVIDKYNIHQSFKKNLNINKLDEDEFLLMKYELEDKYIGNMVFLLSSYFAFNFSTDVYRFSTDDKSFEEDPLKFLEDKIAPFKENEKKAYESYNNIKLISLFKLFSNYDNYPKKIEEILKDENITFFSGYNYPINIPKIITFSSIIFLKHINILDLISKYEDIYIQKSVLNWIFEQFKKNAKNIYWRDLYKLLNLKKEKIIDDTNAIIPLKNTEFLMEFFGILDYKAIAYSLQNGFQLISEDHSHLQFIGDTLQNDMIPTNSMYLITNELTNQNDVDENMNLLEKLHNQNYTYSLPFYSNFVESVKNIALNSNDIWKKNSVIYKIAKSYKWL